MMTLIDRVLLLSFRLHDWASSFLTTNFFLLKRLLLLGAHLSLLGFFLPELRREFGSLAGNLLIVILFLSPAAKIFRMRLLQQLMGLRRELGILFGYLATVHGIGFLIDPAYQGFVLDFLPDRVLSIQTPFLMGVLAYLLTLPLLLTSNNIANRLLGGRNWKRLHRTVYLMALFAVIHRFMMNGLTIGALVQMIILVSGYLLAKLLAWRNFLPPLVRLIAWVAGRYQTYRANLSPVNSTSPLASDSGA
ncbi:MAG: hypothetical protein E6P95_01600 [Candidatus Moraniibacteriota bacterium]|nr:MAG: hypothetical protein E6P95_01600 [Candidatus Moranbacteria bacterium]